MVVLEKTEVHGGITYFEVNKFDRNIERLLCGAVTTAEHKFRPLQHCRFLDEIVSLRNKARNDQLSALNAPPEQALGLDAPSPPKRRRKQLLEPSVVKVHIMSAATDTRHELQLLHKQDSGPLLFELSVSVVSSLQTLAEESLASAVEVSDPHKHPGIHTVRTLRAFRALYTDEEGHSKTKLFNWGDNKQQAFEDAKTFREQHHFDSDSDSK